MDFLTNITLTTEQIEALKKAQLTLRDIRQQMNAEKVPLFINNSEWYPSELDQAECILQREIGLY